MAIVKRELVLVHKQVQADGMRLVKEICFDSSGRKYVHGPYRTDDVAAATAAMNVRDWTKHTEGAELRDAKKVMDRGGALADYTPKDIDKSTFDKLVVKDFMSMAVEDGRNSICKMAPAVAVFSVAQIESMTGLNTSDATDVRNRAINLRDNVCPALISDDGMVKEKI